MTNIRISWISDESDCDTCGTNWADGALVYFNDELCLSLEPHASCFDGTHYDTSDVFRHIIKSLGHAIEEGYG